MTKMKPGDPASWMLFDGVETVPVVQRPGCYICEDPGYSRMGLPLCRKCLVCDGHIAADDSRCDNCGACETVWRHRQHISIDELVKYLFVNEHWQPVRPSLHQLDMLRKALEEEDELGENVA